LIVGSVPLDGGGNPISFTDAFLIADFQSRVQMQAPTFPGTGSFGGKKYILSRHSIVDSGGVVLPGTVAGTVDATSNYY
jgi:hypothetical protein